MANRAMNLLAEKKLLVRYPRRGTFVGLGFDDGAVAAKTAVHLIRLMSGGDNTGLQAEQMMVALRTVIPDARLSCHFFPENSSVRHIHEEVERMAADKSFGGLVLCSCPRAIQEDIARSGVPAVLWGSAYPGVDLPYVDLDQAEIGRLMAEQAVEAGCRRLYFVTREFWREGDTLAFHGVTQKAHKAGLGPDAVRLQNVPVTSGVAVMQSVLESMIRHAASESTEPIAFLCRSMTIAQQLHQVSQSCDAWDARRMTIVFDAGYGVNAEATPGSFIVSKKPLKDVFSSVGRVLLEIMGPDSQKPASVRLPVIVGRSNAEQGLNFHNIKEQE